MRPTALQVLRLCDSLEDDDDVQNVYSNLDIPDEVLAEVAGVKICDCRRSSRSLSTAAHRRFLL